MTAPRPVRNLVFDVGNVLVRWSPDAIARRVEADPARAAALARDFFGHPLWRALNRGEFDEARACQLYADALGLDPAQVRTILAHTKDSLTPIPGAHELLDRLHAAGVPLYSITDNVHEIVAHLRQRYDFWSRLRGAAVSAELGVLKPDPAIYRHLLDTHDLDPAETLFFDDVLRNVEGARQCGMQAALFVDTAGCERDLRAAGLRF